MLEMLNEMVMQIKSNLGDDTKLEEMDRLDDILRNINTNGLDNQSMIAYNECQNHMWKYYSGE